VGTATVGAMILDNRLRTAMLDAWDRRRAGYRRTASLLKEAIELLTYGSIAGWRPWKRRG
jgi:hypothetical protein